MNKGLCGDCLWAQTVTSARGSRFVRCRRSDDDARFAKYPAIPVRVCDGFEVQAGGRLSGAEDAGTSEPLPVIPITAVRFGRASEPEGPTLFERLGGREVVARIVDAFYERVALDPELRPIFPRDLRPGREKQKLFLEQWLGGAERYSERYGPAMLRRRHLPFVISERAAERWLQHMTETLRECDVPPDVASEMLAGLGPLARRMVNEGEGVPLESPDETGADQ